MLLALNTKHLHTVIAPTPAQGEEFFFPSRKPQLSEVNGV